MFAFLKSINWARAWRRAIWTAFFAAFYAIVVYMAKDVGRTQPVVFGIILLAAIVCAVAFVYSRESKEAFVIASLALCVHAFLEISYWSGIVDDTSVQAMREQSAATSRDIVNEKRRSRYASSASRKGAAQVKAEIEALKQDARWPSSSQCTAATTDKSRSYCREYHLLMADLAAAEEAAKLESAVFHTTVETVDIPRNLAKGALWLSDVTGMSVQSATNILVGLMVLFIQAGLALSLRIGWAPEKPRSAPGAALAPEATSAAPAASSPVLRPRVDALTKISGATLPEDHVRDATKMVDEQPVSISYKSVMLPEIDPDGEGTPAPAPAEDVAEEPTNVVPLRSDHPTKAELRIERTPRATENSVSRWLRDCTKSVGYFSRGKPAKDLIESYRDYCEARGELPLPKRKFSTVLRGELDLPKLRGADGKRKSAVMMFPLELVQQTAKRKVA